jgi:enoyl-CoA hydratase/carnithine racemase
VDRLPHLMGRGRALEVILGCDDFDAGLGERYGWINRAIPDQEFEALVEQFARKGLTQNAPLFNKSSSARAMMARPVLLSFIGMSPSPIGSCTATKISREPRVWVPAYGLSAISNAPQTTNRALNMSAFSCPKAYLFWHLWRSSVFSVL